MPFVVARKRSAAPSSASVPRKRRFDRDEIIDSLQRWTREFGEPPRMIDLEPARARRLGQAWRAERFEAGQWPSARMVTGSFGSMSAALSAAGIAARPAPARTAANLSGSDAILDAIRARVRLYGEVPMLADWDPSRARRLGQDWRIARYHRGDWPSVRTVIARFGSVSAAVAAAGAAPSRRPSRTRPEGRTRTCSAGSRPEPSRGSGGRRRRPGGRTQGTGGRASAPGSDGDPWCPDRRSRGGSRVGRGGGRRRRFMLST